MRVTGDCLRAARFAGRFAADFFAGAERDAIFGALFRFVPADDFVDGLALVFLLVLLVLPRAALRFDAVDLRRDFPPDDFDAVAIIEFLEGRYSTPLRKIRTSRHHATSRAGCRPISTCYACGHRACRCCRC